MMETSKPKIILAPEERLVQVQKEINELNIGEKAKVIMESLNNDIVVLEKDTNDIKETNSVVIKRRVILPDKLDKEKTIKKLVEQDTKIVECFKNALTNLNSRIGDVLTILQWLASFEVDLYHIIDDYQLEENEFKQVLEDFLKDKGMTEDEICKLLDLSFKRAYTLRTRIQNVSKRVDGIQDELNQKASQQCVREIQTKLSNKQDKIEDLEVIKNNAATGATALQPSDISDWAKKKEKPTYTAEEVGALPSSTKIPTKVSELDNDNKFLTEHQDISGKANKDDVTRCLANKVDNVTYEKEVMSFSKKLATNQKITITSLVIGGLSFIGMVAMIVKFVFIAM